MRVDHDTLPQGFRIVLDGNAREVAPGAWFGGQPARVMTLNPRAADALARLRRGGPVSDRADGIVARRFVDAGLAHPLPPCVTATPDLTVVVPAHDRIPALERCLAVLGRTFRVVVVDDASRDETGIRDCAQRHGATLLRLPVNSGPAAARNRGLETATTEFVAFVDSDTEPTPEALTRLCAHFADPTVGAVAPRIRVPPDPSAAGRYTAARSSLDLGPAPARVAPYTPVSHVPTAALVVRTSAVRVVPGARGAFDPDLRVGEDVDLVWRLAAAGHRVRYEPRVEVLHDDPVTWGGLYTRRFRYGTSAAPLALRHPHNLAPMIVSPWYAATVTAILARRPVFAAAMFATTWFTTRHAYAAAGLPAHSVQPRHIAAGVWQTGLGTARAATQFGAPVLLAALAWRRTRVPALALLLTPSVTEWYRRRPSLSAAGFAAAALADDVAYGAGVLAGCVEHRTTIPLRPIRAGRPNRGDS